MNLINKVLDKDYIEPVFLNTCYSFSSKERAFSITSWYKLNNQKIELFLLEVKKVTQKQTILKDFENLKKLLIGTKTLQN